MFNWLFKKEQIDPETLTSDDSFMLKKGNCPVCDSKGFYMGPCGGMSQNIMCVRCGVEWNFTPIFGSFKFDFLSYNKEKDKRDKKATE
jgi:hypothetical protein